MFVLSLGEPSGWPLFNEKGCLTVPVNSAGQTPLVLDRNLLEGDEETFLGARLPKAVPDTVLLASEDAVAVCSQE